VNDGTNVTQSGDEKPVRPNVVFPAWVWDRVKKAAIDKKIATGQTLTPGEFVVDIVKKHLGLKAA
jgi:hypothetical protein